MQTCPFDAKSHWNIRILAQSTEIGIIITYDTTYEQAMQLVMRDKNKNKKVHSFNKND